MGDFDSTENVDQYRVKYKLVNSSKDQVAMEENEVRVTQNGKGKGYVGYGLVLLQERGYRSVILRAMGRAINKTVSVAEVLKRHVEGLHQITELGCSEVHEVWLPLEEGLDRVENIRYVSSIAITLSLDPLDISIPGYQAPLPRDQVCVSPTSSEGCRSHTGFRGGGRMYRGGRGKGRGRGGFRDRVYDATPRSADEGSKAVRHHRD